MECAFRRRRNGRSLPSWPRCGHRSGAFDGDGAGILHRNVPQYPFFILIPKDGARASGVQSHQPAVTRRDLGDDAVLAEPPRIGPVPRLEFFLFGKRRVINAVAEGPQGQSHRDARAQTQSRRQNDPRRLSHTRLLVRIARILPFGAPPPHRKKGPRGSLFRSEASAPLDAFAPIKNPRFRLNRGSFVATGGGYFSLFSQGFNISEILKSSHRLLVLRQGRPADEFHRDLSVRPSHGAGGGFFPGNSGH